MQRKKIGWSRRRRQEAGGRGRRQRQEAEASLQKMMFAWAHSFKMCPKDYNLFGIILPKWSNWSMFWPNQRVPFCARTKTLSQAKFYKGRVLCKIILKHFSKSNEIYKINTPLHRSKFKICRNFECFFSKWWIFEIFASNSWVFRILNDFSKSNEIYKMYLIGLKC